MKHIIKTTQYWIFKPIGEGSKYSYVRVQVSDLTPTWFMGYENHMGLVSSVGGDLKAETVLDLEMEWQEAVRNAPL